MGQRDLETLIGNELLFEEQSRRTRQSLSFGFQQNPDEYAKNLQLGKNLGVMPEFVVDNKVDLERLNRMRNLPIDQIQRETPKTSVYFSNQDNAAVSQDDLGLFGTIEKTLNAVPAGLAQGWDKQRQMFLNFKEVMGTISPSEKVELKRLEDLAQKRSVEFKDGLPSWTKAASDVVGMSAYSVLDALQFEGAVGMGTGGAVGLSLSAIGGPTAPVLAPFTGTAGAATGLKVGTTTGLVINTYESSVGEVYDDLKNFKFDDGTKMDPTVARYAAIVAGVPNAALETFSLGKTLKLVPGADKVIGKLSTQQIKTVLARPTMRAAMKDITKKYAVAVGTETFTEGLQKFVSILSREAALQYEGKRENRPYNSTQLQQDVDDILAESTEAFKASVILGGLGGGVKAYSARQQVKKAEQSQAVFDALGETASKSNTLKRMPEKFREFVQTVTQDGPVQNVYIDAQRFSTYFQSVNIDPAAAAQEAGVVNFEEAVATGTDLVIPIAQFAERIAPTEHLAGLKSDMRLRQGDMSLRESQEYLAEQEAVDEEVIAQAQASVGETQPDVVNQIRDDISGQLIAAGNDRATADAYALQYAKVINSLATRNGMDPLTLHQQYSLSVSRPLPEVLTRDTRADINLDPMLDALRAGKSIQDQDIFGPSLVEFVRAQGGIVPSGELVDADIGNRPFQRNLVQPKGLTPDQIGERAVEAGYFPGLDTGSITEADIFDALDEELRGGNPTYAAGNFNQQLLDQRENLNSLAEYLDALGIDVGAITDNAQVRQLIDQVTQQQGLGDQVNELFQRIRAQAEGRSVPNQIDAVSNVESAFEFAGSQSFATNRDFKVALQERVNSAAKAAGVNLDEFSQGTEEYLVRIAMADGITALRTNANAVGWYNEKVTKALRLVSLIHPEVSTDPQAKFAFVWAMAVTSNGLKVDKNFELAEMAYEQWKNSGGKMPTDIGIGTAAGAINKAMGMYNTLIEKHGFEVVERFMTTMQPAGEVQKFTGQKISGENLTTMVYGAAALGPKIGNGFFMNLYGRFEQLTMDRWLMRTWGRWTGTLVEINQAQIKAKRAQLKDVIKALSPADKKAFEGIIKRKLSVSDLDAVGVAIWKASQKPANRLEMAKIGVFDEAGATKIVEIMGEAKKGTERVSYGDELRKVGNALTKYLDGQKEAPSGPPERGNIRKVFSRVLAELQQTYPALTMSDYQALLWYPEKRLYDAAKTADEATDSYEDDEAPDYANAAAKLARAKGISDTDIAGAIAAVDADLQAANGAAGVRPGERGLGDRADGQGNALYQSLDQGDPLSDKRGFIQFGPNRKFNIALLERANLSTFLHETGHFYLEVMGDLADRPDAPQQVKDDYAKVLKYLGLTSRAELTLDGKKPGSAEYQKAVDAHERFARSNEAYLMEGKAPSEELRTIFQKFKSWLTLIYKTFTSLDVKLTNEIREVFDRLYATDEEIKAASEQVITVDMFATAADMGVTEAEFAAYRESVAQTVESGKEALMAKLMKQAQREREAWWKERKAEMRIEVEVEVDLTPVYAAFKTLTEGKLEDGTPIRLNKEALVERYGDEYLKRLPRSFGRIYTRQGGMDPESAAEFLGFESGDKLIEALAGMKPRKEYIEAEVDRRMRETYGDMLTDGSIADEAIAALHNSQRENVLMTELKALRRKQREVAPFVRVERQRQASERRQARAAIETPPASAFRAAAQGLVGQTAVRDLDPYKHLQASRKAARESSRALVSGDFQLAADAKQRELLNHYMYLEATKAREEADAILKYAQKFEKGTTREQMGKAGGSYLEQIDAILDRYEFRRVPLSKIDRRQSLAEWIAEQEAQGLEPAVDGRLLNESRLVNYRQIQVDELRAIRDTVKNIEHLARLKNKLVTKQKEIAFEEAIAELVASAENNGQRRMLPPDLSAMTMREKAGDQVSRFDAALLKMEQLVEWLDGGRVDGPWHTYLWNPISQAQSDENDLHRELTAKIVESLEQMPKEQRKSMLDTYDIPGIGRVTRKYIVSMALNMGNDENMNKMLRGHNWNMEIVQSALDKLSIEDWQFVQATWDNINTLWPQIVELDKKMTGLAPKKVEARPYTVMRNGQEAMTLQGGYFPLVYDPRFSEQGQKQESGSLGQLFEEGYARATTSKGHTEARNEGFAAPLNLDFEQVLTGHLGKVIKDLTHREAIVAANKVLTNREIRNVLQETLGPAYERQFMPWLRSVVNDRNSGATQGLADWSRFMMALRANTVAAVMGFKATTALMQITGLSASLDKVPAKYLGVEFARFLRHPVEMTRQVRELSGEMRNRPANMDRDIRAQLRQMTGQNSLMTQAQRFAFHGIAIMDTMVTVPTWMGAYRKAIDDGKSDEVARLEGDAAVRLTQGAGGPKDLAAVSRNNELMKSLTMFYSYFSTLYARMRDMGRGVESISDMPKFLARSFFVVMIPAFLGDLIVGRGPDDEEDYPQWLARKILLYPMMSIPLLRDVIASIDTGYDYKFTPLASGLEKLTKLGKQAAKAVSDEAELEWDKFAVNAAETAGYLFGVPGTAQMSATGKYLWRVEEGEEEADNFAELLFYAAMGKRKEK